MRRVFKDLCSLEFSTLKVEINAVAANDLRMEALGNLPHFVWFNAFLMNFVILFKKFLQNLGRLL